jgi:hypothetical protein
MTEHGPPQGLTYEELARWYDEHREEMDTWEWVEVPVSVDRKALPIFNLEIEGKDLEKLFRAAEAEGRGLSEFIVSAALEALEKSNRKRKKPA